MFIVRSQLGAVRSVIIVEESKPNYLYHKDVGFPPEVEEIVTSLDGKTIQLRPTAHALSRFNSFWYNYGVNLPEDFIPRDITLKSDGIIEVGFDNSGNLAHILYREPLEGYPEWDIVYAIAYPEGVLKTVYLNRATDTHPTLKADQYRKTLPRHLRYRLSV